MPVTFKILRRLVRHQAAAVAAIENYLLERRGRNRRNCSLFKVISLSSATTGCLLVIAQFGLFQSMEVRSFDLLTQLTTRYESSLSRHREKEHPVVVVEITEQDIQQQKRWPFSDQLFADLLAQLQQHSPQVVGLDIYRDVPHYPGTRNLEQQLQKENVIVIARLDQWGDAQVPSPLNVPSDRVGFNDFVVDPDGVVRRNFMFAAIGNRQLSSFSLRIIEKFLAGKGDLVTAELDALKLGRNKIFRLTEASGGYQTIDTGGYQSLGRYYSTRKLAR